MPTKDSTPTPTPTDIGSFEDFGDVDFDEAVPLSIMILQWYIDAVRPGLENLAVLQVDVRPGGPAARMAPRVDCDSLGLRSRQGVFRRCARGSHG
jgi:hypothetical protein